MASATSAVSITTAPIVGYSAQSAVLKRGKDEIRTSRNTIKYGDVNNSASRERRQGQRPCKSESITVQGNSTNVQDYSSDNSDEDDYFPTLSQLLSPLMRRKALANAKPSHIATAKAKWHIRDDNTARSSSSAAGSSQSDQIELSDVTKAVSRYGRWRQPSKRI